MFSVNAYAMVWKVKEQEEGKKNYIVQMSTSTKKDDGSYEQDFNGFVIICGKAFETKLQEGDTFQIKKCAVSNRYDKEKDKTYYNFFINEIDNVKHHDKENKNDDFQEVSAEDMPFQE